MHEVGTDLYDVVPARARRLERLTDLRENAVALLVEARARRQHARDEEELTRGDARDVRVLPQGLAQRVDVVYAHLARHHPYFTQGRVSLALALVVPLDVLHSGSPVEHPCRDEEQVRKPVQVLARGLTHVLLATERHDAPFGSSAHRARQMRRGRGAASSRQDEFLKRCERPVKLLDLLVEKLHALGFEERVAGNAQLAAQVEKILLHADERAADLFRDVLRKDHPKHRVELVDFAEGADARVVLRHATAGKQAGFAAVAVAQGQYQRAAQLMGAVETQLASLGIRILYMDKMEYDRNLGVLQANLDEHTLQKFWAIGNGMFLEEAIVFALDS